MVKTLSTLNDDLHLDVNGNIATADGLEGLRQKVRQKLRLFQGEWFLDITAGVPYFQDVFVRQTTAGLVAQILNNEILEEPETVEITTFTADINPDTRTFSYAATVSTVFGDMEVTA